MLRTLSFVQFGFKVPCSRVVGACLLVALYAAMAPTSARADEDEQAVEVGSDERVGLVKERPESGPFVETDMGFMVPYTEKIPGTDIEYEMIPVPGGVFKMGSPEDEVGRVKDEGPQVAIKIDPFWIGKTEVTWAEYGHFMKMHDLFKGFETAGKRGIDDDNQVDVITAPSNLYDPTFTFSAGDGPNQPAVTMTQYAAKQYTKWLSLLNDEFYRLPSEAEWEYACRAGTTTAYSFGDDASVLGEYAWFSDNSDDKRHDVAQKKPNPWGLYDMHGGAAEWVLDEHTRNYEPLAEAAKKTDAPLKGDEAVQWPEIVYPRVVRGGSWEMEPEELRSAARLGSDDENWKDKDPNVPLSPWWFTTTPATGVGMRLVRPLRTPDSREAQEKYWEADHEDIELDVEWRIDNEGRGARGVVDESLPDAIKRK